MNPPVSNEVLAAELNSLSKQVNKLEVKLDAYASHFITSEIYDLKHRELELQVNTLATKLEAFSTSTVAKFWVTSTLSGAAGIILALLIQFYLAHQGR